ncbi:MAG: arylsulfatase, partial [Pseudomonadota bacterium]|nr:arylsulfatase [Pseudomonadota bacterium]
MQGMRFTDAHAPSSVCTPSRYAVLTGRYCWRSRLKTGIVWQWDSALIEPDRITVAELLRRQGYRTHCVGKWHLGWNWTLQDGSAPNDHMAFGERPDSARHTMGDRIDYSHPMSGGPIDCGFDTYFGDDVPNFPPYTWFEQDRVVEAPSTPKPDDMFGAPGSMVPEWKLEQVMPTLTRRAVQTIEWAGDEPFFLYFPLTAPHTPIVPLDEFRGCSRAGEYGDYVCQVDWCVGEIMATLDRRGIADDTLLIFTSDNGPERFAWEHIRDHGHYSMAHLRGIKRDAWEGGHRVPYVARWPGVVPAGSECPHVTMLGDLLSTCAEIAGADVPSGVGEDSVSILPLLQARSGPDGVRAYTVHHS